MPVNMQTIAIKLNFSCSFEIESFIWLYANCNKKMMNKANLLDFDIFMLLWNVGKYVRIQ